MKPDTEPAEMVVHLDAELKSLSPRQLKSRIKKEAMRETGADRVVIHGDHIYIHKRAGNQVVRYRLVVVFGPTTPRNAA